MLVVDGERCIVGGINLSARFIDPPNQCPWLDYAIFLEGPVVKEIQYKAQRHFFKYFKTFRPQKINYHHLEFDPEIVPVINDWLYRKQEVYREYLKAILNAKEEITLIASYFLPNKKLLNRLKKQAKKGVRINIIMGHNSDHFFDIWPRKYFYNWFHKNNIHIYEWNQSIVHAKLTLIDNRWCSVGSYNFNALSDYGNSELNLNITEKGFVRKAQAEVMAIKEFSTHFYPTQLSLWQRLKSTWAFSIFTIMRWLYLWYINRHYNRI
jgi:cardiolipin synthase